jgi:hypothetical protein
MRLVLSVLLFALPASAKEAAALNRQVAIAANTLGMQRYHAGELRGAAEQFRVAIDSDSSYVNAHYNLACVASRLGDSKTALKELAWLAENKDGHIKLSKARVDPDLDFVSVLPEAREKLGLLPFEKSRPSTWLTERGGVWSAELPQQDCDERSYTLIFHEDSVTLRIHELCAGKLADGEFHGKLSLTPVSVMINDWKAWPGQVPLSFADCPNAEAQGACFMLANGRSQLGPFHRGLPFPRDHRQALR